MKKTRLIPAILAAAMASSLTGCMKDLETDFHEPGTDIIFGVSNTGSDNEETRTEYSGKNQDNADIYSNPTNTTYERINWVTDKDRIRILCNQATGKANASTKTADYVIYNVSMNSSDMKKSQASITSCDNNSLQWGTSNPHYFYALYPAPGTVSNYSFSTYPSVTTTNSKIEKDADNANKAKITGVIPATQEVVKSGNIYKPNMNYAYMYAATRFNPASSGNVTLSFEPLVTTLEFILSDNSADHITSKLTTLELTASTTLTGTFTAPIDVTSGSPSVGTPTLNNTGKKITITLPDGGIVLSSSSKIHVTFLTLPVDQKDLKLTLTFANGNQRTILLKNLNSNQVTAMRKAYFDLTVPGTIPYTITVTGPTANVGGYGGSQTFKVKSYKQGNSGNVAVGWQVQSYQYQVNGGTWTSGKPDWFNLSDTSGSGSVSDASYTATFTANTATKAKTWTNKTEIGTSDRPINLALRDVQGNYNGANNPVDAKMTTANCYVVSQPGWYCFPCIYGNGMVNNGDNATAFPGTIKNHSNNAITTPWIQNNAGLGVILSDGSRLSAKLMWQDKNGLVSSLSHYLEGPNDYASHSNQGRYIKFYVSPSDIGQGNAVIALTVDNVVVWCWHIWVIESTRVGSKKVYPGSGSVANPVSFLDANLGWVDADQVPASRAVKVTLVQNSSGKTASFTVTQNAKTYPNGSNTYYQWGRKDPMLGWNANYTAARSQWGNGQWTIVASQSNLDNAVQHPNYFFAGSWEWTPENHHNLWNANSGGATSDSQVTKTAYDPCPAGYKVPNQKAFAGFYYTNATTTSIVKDYDGKYNYDYGWRFKTSGSGAQEVFIPGIYLRESTSGLIENYRLQGGSPTGVWLDAYKGGYYWTAALSTYMEIRDHKNGATIPEINNLVKDVGGYGMAVRCVKQ